MLNSVVLPAPFGPITAKISPCCTVEATRDRRRRRPRKRFETPSTERSALIGVALQAELAREPRPDAVRQHHDDDQQADAVEHLLARRATSKPNACSVSRHRLRQAGQQERAEDRTEQRADAADDRREDQLDRARDVEDLLGKQVVVIEREEHARDDVMPAEITTAIIL